MKFQRYRIIRFISSICAVESAYWLCLTAGLWQSGKSIASFAIFALCVVGMDRLYALIIDLLRIAVAPTAQPLAGKR